MGWEVQRYVEDSGRLSLNNAMRSLIIYYNYRQAIAAQVRGRQNWAKPWSCLFPCLVPGPWALGPISLPLFPFPLPSFTPFPCFPLLYTINTAPQCYSPFPALYPHSFPCSLLFFPFPFPPLSCLLYLPLSPIPFPF